MLLVRAHHVGDVPELFGNPRDVALREPAIVGCPDHPPPSVVDPTDEALHRMRRERAPCLLGVRDHPRAREEERAHPVPLKRLSRGA